MLSKLALLIVGTTLAQTQHGLQLKISAEDGLFSGNTDGHVQVLFAPAGIDPLDDTDVTSSPNYFYGQNVFDFGCDDTVTLMGGDGREISFGVWGFPNASLDELPTGQYTVQAFLNRYEIVTRSDGSQVSVRFPCGDGALPINGPGSLITTPTNVTVSSDFQTLDLTLNDIVPVDAFNGTEIGGCHQGNYADTELLKHIKIRSKVLSDFWNRDMYVGANVLLPHGYEPNNTKKRYPVIYSQDHWAGGDAPFA